MNSVTISSTEFGYHGDASAFCFHQQKVLNYKKLNFEDAYVRKW